MKALDICDASERLFGIALSGGDYTKDLQTHITGTGIELMGARQNLIIAARAAGKQCFDKVYTNLNDTEGFRKDVETIHLMGFDGKSIINPRQIRIVHEIFTPSQKDIAFSEKVVKEIDSKSPGISVFTVDGKMIDIAFYDGAKRTIELAKTSGVYKGNCKMINAVGRDIPEEILKITGKEIFQGNHYKDGYTYKMDGPDDPCRHGRKKASSFRASQTYL